MVLFARVQLDILEYIHDKEYVHADVKASNLLVGYTDPQQVSDDDVLFRRVLYNKAHVLHSFLANVNVSSRSLYGIARLSVVCLSSVTLVRPTQAVQIFGNISTALGTLAIR